MTQVNRVRGKRPRIENNCLENRCANDVYMGDNVHASRDFTPKNCSDVPGVTCLAVRVRRRVQAKERPRPAYEAACAASPAHGGRLYEIACGKCWPRPMAGCRRCRRHCISRWRCSPSAKAGQATIVGSQGRSLRNRQRGRTRKDQPKQCRSQPSHSVVLSGIRFGQTRTISRASLFFKDTPCSVLLHAKRDIRPLPRPPQNRQRLRCLSKRDCYDRTIRSRRRKYSTRTAAPRA